MRRTILLLATMAVTLLMASGVALAVNNIGTNGPDTLRGTNGADTLVGVGGNDELYALGGRDTLLGGPGKDVVLGGNENRAFGSDKNLAAGPGNDVVGGGNGSDNVVGEAGNDLMSDGQVEYDQSKDILSGGAGNDAIIVVNSPAFEDIVTCGSSFDRLIADRKDVVAPDCERVFIGVASFEEFFNSIPQSFFEGLPPQFSPN
jgi:Ca2+-binding RTX toxin-like protein